MFGISKCVILIYKFVCFDVIVVLAWISLVAVGTICFLTLIFQFVFLVFCLDAEKTEGNGTKGNLTDFIY
jgi:hypothetical protein